ncbi:8788_t:CDS:2, partial [Diversispora eburnea]
MVNQNNFSYDTLRLLAIKAFIYALIIGKHQKIWSLMNDEDVCDKCRKYINSVKIDDRTPKLFLKFIRDSIIPLFWSIEVSESQDMYCIKTAISWMNSLGFYYHSSSIMVSDFLCPCHGTLKYNNQCARNLIEPGKNRDGYWTNADLIKQLQEKVIPIFNELHSTSIGLFCFDSSQNHQSCTPDALNAVSLNLKDGGKNKGICTILEERGLWRNNLKLE